MKSTSPYQVQELLTQVARGDEKAFEIFFSDYSKLVYSFLYRHTNEVQLADDLVQDIFTRIWLARETLPEVRNLNAYLFILAKSHVINLVKKRVQERKRQVKWMESLDDESSQVEKELYLDLIDQAVAQLPEQQRKTWIMSRRQGMKYKEIALEMGISAETVKTYLQHANSGISKFVVSKADLGVLILLLKIL